MNSTQIKARQQQIHETLTRLAKAVVENEGFLRLLHDQYDSLSAELDFWQRERQRRVDRGEEDCDTNPAPDATGSNWQSPEDVDLTGVATTGEPMPYVPKVQYHDPMSGEPRALPRVDVEMIETGKVWTAEEILRREG